MTRFGEISPKWQYFKSLGNCLRVFLIFGKMLNLLWKFWYAFGHIFIVTNGQIWKNYYSHLVTLIDRHCHWWLTCSSQSGWSLSLMRSSAIGSLIFSMYSLYSYNSLQSLNVKDSGYLQPIMKKISSWKQWTHRDRSIHIERARSSTEIRQNQTSFYLL